MHKKLFLSILVLALIVAHKQAIAQANIWQWANSAGIFGDEYVNSVCTDASGNVYVTGYFEGDSIIFGSTTLYRSSQWGDIFLVKYDASGNVLWAERAGGTGRDQSNSVTTDASGNVYITGNFNSSSIIFGTDTLTNANIYPDIFLAKYDASGSILWAKSAGGSSRDYGNSVSADASGNVYVTGYFESDTITFETTSLINTGSNDIFAAKYDASGKVLWAKRTGGTDRDMGSSVSTDVSGNVYVTGSFSSKSITIGSTTLTNAGSAGTPDIFIAKYDASGMVLWAKNAGGSNHDYSSSITTDNSGNLYITGYFFSPSITFGSTTLTNAGAYDIFIAKYDASGKVLWAKKAGGTGYDYANSISTDNLENVYIAGIFNSPSIIFGVDTLTNAGSNNFFLTKYDTSGNIILAKSTSGTDINSSISVSADASGNVYIAGTFNTKSITFGTHILYNVFRYDIFLAKLGMCSNTASSKKVTSCNSFVWNNKTYTASGIYIDTIANAAGCDSIMTLDLTIHTLPTVTLVLDPDTVCINTGSYSLAGGSPLGGTYSGPGVSNEDFDPSAAGVGLHTIIYTYTNIRGCTDSTTAQIFVDICTGIETAPGMKAFIIYPNPFSEQTVLQSNIVLRNATLTVANYLGQTVKQVKEINRQTVLLPRGNLVSGLYFIRLAQDNKVIATQKIIITD